MTSLPYNLFLARRAINYVNNKIQVISPNRLPTETNEQKDLKKELERRLENRRNAADLRADAVSGNIFTRNKIRTIMLLTNASTIESKIGNCGEKAILAFYYLKMQQVEPLELFDASMGEAADDYHTFVVIGRTRGIETDPSTWNHETVVCDPWAEQVYPSYSYNSHAQFTGELILIYRQGPNISQHVPYHLL
ncbi:hypothetical protein [Xenorhabdus bharatensis]|uniref:hypothetical protein n=1 Tax=Xenorhabdus bharatensis TaxID=3136256 RepID=UPI0030F3D96E